MGLADFLALPMWDWVHLLSGPLWTCPRTAIIRWAAHGPMLSSRPFFFSLCGHVKDLFAYFIRTFYNLFLLDSLPLLTMIKLSSKHLTIACMYISLFTASRETQTLTLKLQLSYKATFISFGVFSFDFFIGIPVIMSLFLLPFTPEILTCPYLLGSTFFYYQSKPFRLWTKNLQCQLLLGETFLLASSFPSNLYSLSLSVKHFIALVSPTLVIGTLKSIITLVSFAFSKDYYILKPYQNHSFFA